MAFAWMILIAHRLFKGEVILVKLTPMVSHAHQVVEKMAFIKLVNKENFWGE
jgi:hypothetical protein